MASSNSPDRPDRGSSSPVAISTAGETNAEAQLLAGVSQNLGQYVLLEKLGQGGMGVVFKARHTRLKKDVAVKVLRHQPLKDDEVLVARFAREMEVIGRLQHPHIVQAYDAGEVDGLLYLVMEYVDGQTLEVLCRQGPLPSDVACELFRQAALGMQHAHDHGILHRDIKPSNLLVRSDGVVKLADLGLGRLCAESEETDLTDPGHVVGTIDYMSPEQAQGSREIDQRSDLYSLGCSLYRARLAGKIPFGKPEFETTYAKLRAHIERDPAPLADLRSDLSDELLRLVADLMAKNPQARPASAAEVADRLARLPEVAGRTASFSLPSQILIDSNHGQPGSTQLPPLTTRHWPIELKQRRRRVAATMLAFVTLGLLLAFAVWGWGTGPDGSKNGSDDTVSKDQLAYDESSAGFVVKNLQWYPLLEMGKPRVVAWNDEDGTATLRHQPELSQMVLSTSDLGLVALGRTARAGYTVQADLYQQRWPGRIGLFFGLHPLEGEPAKYRFQYLTIENIRTFAGQEKTVVRRFLAVQDLREGHAKPPVLIELGQAEVSYPQSQPLLVELTVASEGLKSVRWGGQPLPGLCQTGEGLTTSEDYIGDFGIYLHSTDGIVRNARVMRLP